MTPGLKIPPDLPPDHPVFRQPPVPERLAKLLSQYDAIHPGLRLDKFLAPVVNQEHQKERLRRVANDAQRRTRSRPSPGVGTPCSTS